MDRFTFLRSMPWFDPDDDVRGEICFDGLCRFYLNSVHSGHDMLAFSSGPLGLISDTRVQIGTVARGAAGSKRHGGDSSAYSAPRGIFASFEAGGRALHGVITHASVAQLAVEVAHEMEDPFIVLEFPSTPLVQLRLQSLSNLRSLANIEQLQCLIDEVRCDGLVARRIADAGSRPPPPPHEAREPTDISQADRLAHWQAFVRCTNALAARLDAAGFESPTGNAQCAIASSRPSDVLTSLPAHLTRAMGGTRVALQAARDSAETRAAAAEARYMARVLRELTESHAHGSTPKPTRRTFATAASTSSSNSKSPGSGTTAAGGNLGSCGIRGARPAPALSAEREALRQARLAVMLGMRLPRRIINY